MREYQRWIPGAILFFGCLLLLSVQRQRAVPLRAPLSTIDMPVEGYQTFDQVISDEEQRVAGMSDYLLRVYHADSTRLFSVYVGYYEEQTQGRTIHSPRNCLPGAGWEPLESERRTIVTNAGPVTVNRYMLANQSARALVYYWYQGRGRTEASEYRVKWNLQRDAALRGRTEEALVRIVVPLMPGIKDPDAIAEAMAKKLPAEVWEKLPA